MVFSPVSQRHGECVSLGPLRECGRTTHLFADTGAFSAVVWRPALRKSGAGVELGRVEMEDEAVVEAVQVGVRSSVVPRGPLCARS